MVLRFWACLRGFAGPTVTDIAEPWSMLCCEALLRLLQRWTAALVTTSLQVEYVQLTQG